MAADREQACAPALNCAAAGGLLAIGCSLRGGFDFISHCEDFFHTLLLWVVFSAQRL